MTACARDGSSAQPGTAVQPGTSSGADDLALDGEWQLVAATVEDAAVALRPDAPITLTVDAEVVSGRAACNSYFATMTVDGDAVALTDVGVTEMACGGPAMELERAYVSALATVDAGSRTQDQLVLAGVGTELTYTAAPPVDALPLVGTAWLLESVIGGSGPDATASSPVGEPATLQLADDGTLTGGTGCNGLGGAWAADGDVVQTADLVSRLMLCGPPVDEQERHVLAVLTGPFTADVQADRLTLTLATGEALVYRADPDADRPAATPTAVPTS